MSRSQLTEQYQRVMSLVEQLRALAEDERNFILDLLVPLPEQPEVKKAAKRASKKSSKSASKSSRAQSLSGVIQRTPKVRVADGDRCYKILSSGGVNAPCNLPSDDNVHHKQTDPDYHPFVSASDAATATGRSSTNGGAGSVEEEIDQAVESARV